MVRSTRPLLLCLLVVPSILGASDPPVSLGDFGLIDHRGTQWTLSRLGHSRAVVILTQANDCARNIDLLPKYKLLRTVWEERGFEFLMLNSAADDLQSVRSIATVYDIDFPILLDDSRLVAQTLGVTHAGEVLVIEPRSRRLLYRGPLTAGSATSGPRGVLKFDGALEGVLVGAAAGNVEATVTVAPSAEAVAACAVPKEEEDGVPDYATDVAPVLMGNCTRCHAEGGIAPFAMNRYPVVRGFAPMIREVLMTKRMPPMQVDPHYNRFENASYISTADVQTLVRWIDAGAPRGDAVVDPLEREVKPLQTQWQLGEPDYIVDVPAFDVPATGVIDYFNHTIDLPFDEDKWVRAVQFIPGDSRVLHHLLAYVAAPDTPVGELAVSEDNVADFLEGYAPGKADATPFPEGTGVFIEKGQKLAMQMHYTPIGVAVTDRTRLGLYFYDEPPQHKYQTHSISHWAGGVLEIPAGEANHRMNHNYVVREDMMLYALRPHMHYRGKAFRFSAVYPDQSTEVLLNVPRYDFKWQPTYRITEPKLLPAGTRIIIDGVYDNSAYHPGNPDPKAVVAGGLQSWDEMFIGYITYTLPNSRR
jgi:peroxiredoxin